MTEVASERERDELRRLNRHSTPQAAEEREQSKTAHEGIGPAESKELLKGSFPGPLRDLNSDPARLVTGMEVDRMLGAHGARVWVGSNERAVIESTTPIRSSRGGQGPAPVDLSLGMLKGRFAPVNPLVDVTLPVNSADQATVGKRFGIAPQGVDSVQGTRLGTRDVFYPATRPDSDTIVAPVSFGVEILEQLRSIKSPEKFRYKLDLPAGATLRSNRFGAQVIADSGEALFEVTPPVAVDAQETPVPATMRVEGSSVVVEIPHRRQDVAYPILLDPSFQETREESPPFHLWYNNNPWGTYSLAQQPSHLAAISHGSQEYGAGTWAQWEYTPPGTTAYIERTVFNGIYFIPHSCEEKTQPYGYIGMHNGSAWDFLLGFWGGESYSPSKDSGKVGGGSTRKAIVGIRADKWVKVACAHEIYVGGVTVTENDPEVPTVSVTGVPSGWIGPGFGNVTVTASDPGFGISRISLYNGKTTTTNDMGLCNGTATSRCPNAPGGWAVKPPYVDGIRNLQVTAEDPLGKVGEWNKQVKVDLRSPVINLQGELAEATKTTGKQEVPQDRGTGDTDELRFPVYELKVTATDGKAGTPAEENSGVERLEVELDGENVLDEPLTTESPCDNCDLTETVPIELTELSTDEVHVVEVIAKDHVGNKETRKIEFEYIPATGMKEEYVLQRFPLDDGIEREGEEVEHGPELAVNVMNGNLVYHQRDVNVEGPNVDLEVERFYNSQLPEEENSEWGDGWTLAQTPTIDVEPAEGPEGEESARLVEATGSVLGSVNLPGEGSEDGFLPRLRAVANAEGEGPPSLTDTETGSRTVFDMAGKTTELETAGPASIEYSYEDGVLAEIEVKDPNSSSLTPEPPPEIEISSQPEFLDAFDGAGELTAAADAAVDADGDLWVVDRGSDRLLRFNAKGEFADEFGASGSGAGELRRPAAAAIDADGDIWVADAGNRRVQEFEDDGDFIQALGSAGGGPGEFGGGGPEGIAIAADGSVWVADTDNGRLQRFSAEGAFIEVAGASGEGQLLEPVGIDIAPDGSIWVADAGRDRLFQFDEEGEYVDQLGSAGSGKGQFSLPTDIHIDGRGRIWVIDQGNARVQQFDSQGGFVTSFGAIGHGDGEFTHPTAIATDAGGSVWVLDGGRGHQRPSPAVPPQAPPVAAYSFDEMAGAVAHDSAGENDGSLQNGAQWSESGRFGGAIRFDGVDDLVTVPDSNDLDFTTAFTLEAWVKPEEGIEWGTVMMKERPGGENYHLHAAHEGLGPAGYVVSAEGWAPIESETPLPANAWSHLVLTYDGEDLRLYVDGELEASEPAATILTSNDPLQIGGNLVWGEEDFFEGLIDEVRLYDRALSQGEIEADRVTAIETPPDSGPIAAYSFDEGEGETATDATGNGHDGEIEGAEWIAGKFGAALDFKTWEEDLLSVPDSERLQLTGGAFTLEAWVKPRDHHYWTPIISKLTDEYFSYAVYVGGREAGVPEGFISNQTWVEEGAAATAAIPLDTWSHVALTSDGKQLRLYVNGEVVGTGPAIGVQDSEGPLEIGGNSILESFFDGALDEVRIYERALSEAEIAEEAEAPQSFGGGDRIQKWRDPTYIPDYRYAISGSFGSQGEGEGELREPADILAAPNGQLWVADAGNDRAQRFDALGQYVSGFGTSGDDEGELDSPSALALRDGELWVVDTGNDRVQVFTEEGERMLVLGESGSDPGEFSEPSGIAIDPDGNVWVADTGNSRLQIFDPSGEPLDVVGAPGSEPGEFDEPRGLAFDSSGHLWVADTGNNRLQRLNAKGEAIATVGSQGDGDGEFETPAAVEIDENGIVWVGDSGNHRVQALDEDGNYLQQLGTPGAGGENLDLKAPMGMAPDTEGSLWVSDGGNDRIQKIVPPELGVEEEAEAILDARNDPKVAVETSDDLVSSLEGPGAGEHSYDHSGDDLVAHDGPEGETRYEYDDGLLTEVELPNGTLAEIEYEPSYNRVSKVSVTQASSESKETTSFSYSAEPRKTIVTLPSSPALHYQFLADGSLFKWWNAAEPPKLTLTGTLVDNKETATPIEPGLHNLEVEARSAEPIERIQVITHGNMLVSEKICTTGPGVDCMEDLDEWVLETSELLPGVMQIEVIAEDMIEQVASERFWVNVPYTPPPPPDAPNRPTFADIKKFRATFGLDLDLNPVSEERRYNDRIFALINAWNHPGRPEGQVARSSSQRWGVPLRPIDVVEMEYREWYIDANVPQIEKWGTDTYPGSYAGYEVDHSGGGVLRVGFTAEQAARVTEMLDQLALAAEERVSPFMTVPSFSYAALDGKEEDILNAAETDSILAPLVTEIMIGESSRAVLVGSLNVPAAEARIVQIFGSLAGVTVYFEPGGEPVAEDCNKAGKRHRQSGRMLGGDGIYTDWEPGKELSILPTCASAGFGAIEPRVTAHGDAKKPFLLTVGHAAKLNTVTYRLHNPTVARRADIRDVGSRIGRVTKDPLHAGAGRIDAAAIELNSGGLVPFAIFNRDGANPAQGPAGVAFKGMPVCTSGARTRKIECGYVRGFAHYFYPNTPNMPHKNHLIAVRGMRVDPGDSGAPVWQSRTMRSIGLMSGKSQNGTKWVTPLLTTKYGAGKRVIGALNSAQMSGLYINTLPNG